MRRGYSELPGFGLARLWEYREAFASASLSLNTALTHLHHVGEWICCGDTRLMWVVY
jgi:hypothetical protein